MGNIIKDYMTTRTFKRFNFDDLLMENIVSYLRPKEYHMLNRSYRCKALLNIDPDKLFSRIVSSEEDRDDILKLVTSGKLPTTLSVRYWGILFSRDFRHTMDENTASKFSNKEVRYLAMEYVLEKDLYKNRNILLDNIIRNNFEPLFRRLVRSSDMDRILYRLLYTSDICPNSYLSLVKTEEQRNVLTCATIRQLDNGSDHLYPYVKSCGLLNPSIIEAYDKLRYKLLNKLKGHITTNDRLIYRYRSLPRPMRIIEPYPTDVILHYTDDARTIKRKIRDVKNSNNEILYFL
jgi:hypothetical protein